MESSEADLNIFARPQGMQSLVWGDEAMAFPLGKVVAEDDFLEFVVVEGIDAELPGELALG